jgi:type II secretory pathway pseudopilin PulG
MLNKKGAMFGLDARIALAIFGALSVISGAALYSAIKESKVTAAIAEMQELGKSFDAFFLDVGQLPEIYSGSSYTFSTTDIVTNTNTLDNWNGPYTSLNVRGVTSYDSPVTGGYLLIMHRPGTDWGGTEGDTAPPADCSAAPCYVWISYGAADRNLAYAIEERIDGETRDNAKGKVRLWDYTSGGNAGKTNIYYQYSVAPVQP